MLKEWHIWDFPDTIYIKLSDESRKHLYRDIIKVFGSRNKAANALRIHTTSLRDILQRGKDSENFDVYISVSILKRIIEIYPEHKISIEKNIVAYRARSGNSVDNPVLPIKETPELYSIVAHMICDGSAGKRKTPYYANTRLELIEEVKQYLQIFGKVETKQYMNNSGVNCLMFPKAITDFMSYIFEIEFVRTKNLPKKIFSAPDKCKYTFIRAMFDDEGAISKRGQIIFVQKNKGVITDLKKLLQSVGIESGTIYTSKNNCNYLTVLAESREIFETQIGFTHKNKTILLTESVNKYRERKMKNKIEDKIIGLISSTQKLTRFEIANKINHPLFSTTEVLYELRKQGRLKSTFIKKNEPYIWSKA